MQTQFDIRRLRDPDDETEVALLLFGPLSHVATHGSLGTADNGCFVVVNAWNRQGALFQGADHVDVLAQSYVQEKLDLPTEALAELATSAIADALGRPAFLPRQVKERMAKNG